MPSASRARRRRRNAADIERIRGYRASIGGKKLQIIRGEFHRHTEISGDGGNDGPLEDMWRYAIDVASMDWLGCGDHDNGGHREYTWWLTQKTTDAFRLPGVSIRRIAYERSVRYPEGHRNVIFTRRGIRTLPRLPITDRDNVVHAPDTQMLYKYLQALRRHLRLAHERHRAWAPTGATTIRASSRWSRSIRAAARTTSGPARRARRAKRFDRRLGAQGLRQPGLAEGLQVLVRVEQRPRLDAHQLRLVYCGGKHPRGDVRRR